jgi:hypothetical protein
MTLKKEEALYLFVRGNELLKQDSMISEIYEKYRDEDGFFIIILVIFILPTEKLSPLEIILLSFEKLLLIILKSTLKKKF